MDKAKRDKAVADLIGYTQDFGAFLQSANPNLPKTVAADLVKHHVVTLKEVIDAQEGPGWGVHGSACGGRSHADDHRSARRGHREAAPRQVSAASPGARPGSIPSRGIDPGPRRGISDLPRESGYRAPRPYRSRALSQRIRRRVAAATPLKFSSMACCESGHVLSGCG